MVNEELEFGYRLINALQLSTASHRGNDKLDVARRDADRIHAFALLMVARHPNQPVAHLLLDKAHIQHAKNYWRLHDREGVKRSWIMAIEAARQALSLDPANERARGDVTEFQRRLDDLLNPRPEPVVSSTIVHEGKDGRYWPVSIGP